MNIRLHRQCKKQLKKLSEKQKHVVKQRLHVFLNDPFDPQLNNHALKGTYLN